MLLFRVLRACKGAGGFIGQLREACRGVVGFNGRCSGARSGDGGFMLAYISGRRGAVGFKAATSLRPVREKVRPARPDCGCEREKVRPARPGVGASAKKFALQAQNGRKTLFSGALGELFAEMPLDGPRRANFFAEMPLEALCWATFVAVVLVVLAVGLRYPRREPHSVTRPWHCGVRAVDNEARASCR